MFKCAKVSLPLLVILILETDYFCISSTTAFIQGASEMDHIVCQERIEALVV